MKSMNLAQACRHFTPVLLGVASIYLATGCSGAQDETSVEPPAAELRASEPTQSELSVASWSVWAEENDTFRIEGRDDTGTRQVEVLVHRDAQHPQDSVDVETIFPESGRARVARNGDLAEVTSEYTGRLARALHADLGSPPSETASLGAFTASDESKDDVGVGRFALSNPLEGYVFLNWSLFSYAGDVPVSEAYCRGGVRHHFTTSALNGATCRVHWFSEITSDCRLMLHYENFGGRTAQCNWAVYTQD